MTQSDCIFLGGTLACCEAAAMARISYHAVKLLNHSEKDALFVQSFIFLLFLLVLPILAIASFLT